MVTQADMERRWGLTPHAALHAARLLSRFPDARPTSGRRSVRRNREVGGVPNSLHLSGRALDVVVPRSQIAEFVRFAWRQRVTPRCTGPEEVLDEDDHVHLAW